MSLRNQRGFSLVELSVAVAVAGLVLAFSTPAIGRYLIEARLRNSASTFANELRLARARAVANNSKMWFWTWSDINYYWIGEQRWQGASGWGSTTWRGPIYLPSTVLVKNPDFNGLNYVIYSPDGKPSGSGSVTLISTTAHPDTVQINLDLSGAVWQ